MAEQKGSAGSVVVALLIFVIAAIVYFMYAADQRQKQQADAYRRQLLLEELISRPAALSAPPPELLSTSDVQVAYIRSQRGRGYYSVDVKVTNVGTRTMGLCEVTCVAIGTDGQEIGFAKNLVTGVDDRVDAGGSTYHTFVVDVGNREASRFRYQVDRVKPPNK